MQARTAWRVLGIAATEDIGALRRAYADKLRAIDVDADPAGFARLREARDVALRLARSMAAHEPESAPTQAEADTERVLPAADFIGTSAPFLNHARPPGAIETARPTDPAPWRLLPPIPDGGEVRLVPLDRERLRFDTPPLERVGVGGDVTLTPATDVFDAAYRTILTLLDPGGAAQGAALSSEDSRALDAALDLVLADPRLDELAFHADAERWFGEVLGDAIPRSDPILYRVADRLGWLGTRDRIGQSPGTERLVDRIETLMFLAAVERPDHRLHRAWREVTKPAMETSRRNLTISRKRMTELLTLIRTRRPDAEDYLDAYRVALWERKGSVEGPSRWIWIVLVVTFFRLVSYFGQDTEPSRPTSPIDSSIPKLAVGQSQPLRELAGDLDLALLSIADGFTTALVRQENPDLYDRLAGRWHAAKSAGTPTATFLTNTRRYLYDLLGYSLSRAKYDDIAAWRRQELVELKAVGARGAEACDLYLKGDFDPAPFLSESSRLARRALVSRILLADDGPDPSAKPGDRTFRIAGPVIDQLQDRTKLDNEALTAALGGEGTAEARCRIRVALLETALDLPRANGLDLLRQM